MASIVDEETAKAWQELVGKKSKKEEDKEVKEEKEEKEAEIDQDKEIAAAWLTGGLESEISSPGVSAPVLQAEAVSSLEDFAETVPKKEEEKEVKPYVARMYETEAAHENEKEEVYEESAENLFNRMVRPLDAAELRQDMPRVRMQTASELMNENEDAREIVKYIERKQDTSALPFMKQDREFKKYKRMH
jgi:hypothetical protein